MEAIGLFGAELKQLVERREQRRLKQLGFVSFEPLHDLQRLCAIGDELVDLRDGFDVIGVKEPDGLVGLAGALRRKLAR